MKKKLKLIYLDVCALSRPFDEQDYLRIRLETEAVNLILSKVKEGYYKCLNHKINVWRGNPVTFCEMEHLR